MRRERGKGRGPGRGVEASHLPKQRAGEGRGGQGCKDERNWPANVFLGDGSARREIVLRPYCLFCSEKQFFFLLFIFWTALLSLIASDVRKSPIHTLSKFVAGENGGIKKMSSSHLVAEAAAPAGPLWTTLWAMLWATPIPAQRTFEAVAPCSQVKKNR